MKNKNILSKVIVKVGCLAISVLFMGLLFPFGNAVADSIGVSTPEELVYYFENGGDIKLLNDITLDSNTFIHSDVTLDLNGFTLDLSDDSLVPIESSLTLEDNSGAGSITGTASFPIQIGNSTNGGELILNSGIINCQGDFCICNYGSLEINGGAIIGKDYVVYNQSDSLVMNGGTVTATEGTSVGNYAEGASFVMNGGLVKTLGDDVAVRLSRPYTSFVMNGGTIEATYGEEGTSDGASAIAAFRDTEVTINDGTVIGFSNTLTGNGSSSGANDGSRAKFNINGGTITSLTAAAIFAPSYDGVTTITGGVVRGKTGIEIRAGTLNVSGGTIIGDGEYLVTPALSGLTTWGAAISTAQYSNPQPIYVNITGGEFEGSHTISNGNPLSHDEATLEMIEINVEGGEFSGDDLDDVTDNISEGYRDIDISTGSTDKIAVVQINPIGYYLSAKTSGSVDISGNVRTTATDYSDINVLSNCRAGYDAVMSSSVDDNKLYLNSDDSSSYNLSAIQDGSALITTPNTWGYLQANDPSYVPTSADPYYAVPALSSSPAVLKTTEGTASDEDINDTFRMYYGANIGSNLRAGNYKMIQDETGEAGKIVYQITANPTCISMPVEVDFNKNLDGEGGEEDDGTNVDNFPTFMNNTINYITPELATITLSDMIPTRDDYLFVEWNTSPDGTGNAYQPNEVIVIGEGGTEIIGDITFYAIWTDGCAGATICYDGNGADAGAMEDQTGERGTVVTLDPSNFSRTGYGFAGWNTKADGTGTNYGPQQRFALPKSGGTILYANWIESTGTLQTWNGANSMEEGDIIALTDERDGQTYAVAKLADGKVWFIENSRTDPSEAKFNLLNTNHPTKAFLDGAPDSSSSNQLCNQNNEGCVDTLSYNTNNLAQSPTDVDARYSYGVMYNWYTATAGNGTYNFTNTSGEDEDGNVSGDICPSGWHLPTGNNGEYVTLNDAIEGYSASDTRLRPMPYNFVRSGEYYGESAAGRGEYGRYWTATASEKNKSYRFGFAYNTVTPNGTWNKWDGLAVRCIYDGDRIPQSKVTINFDEHVRSIKLSNVTYGEREITTSGTVVTLANSTPYIITAEFDDGYTIDTWSTTAGGQITSATSVSTVYTVTDATTLSLSSKIATLTTYTLNYDTGASSDVIPPDVATSYNASYDFTITSTVPVIFGESFIGWSETQGAITADYHAGDTITLTNPDPDTTSSVSKTLYAVYQIDSCPVGNICYFGNGAESGTMSNQTASTGQNVVLIASNFAKPGYGFAGWVTDPNATPYGSQATITVPDVSTAGLKLYAKWVQSVGDLQGWTGCDGLGQGAVTALTDTRDNQTYAVAKLADGKCWTIENLRLNTNTATINSLNTNNPSSDFLTNAPKIKPNSNLCTSTGSACEDKIQFNMNNLDRELTQSPDGTGNQVAWYSYGAYYNWYTVTAGNGFHSTVGGVSGDICPIGWHLPTGGDNGEYSTLNTAIGGGSTNDRVWRAYPNNFVLSGEYKGNSRNNGYSQARVWTSTAKDSNNGNRLGVETNKVTPAGAWNKWEGFTVRCKLTDNQ